MKHQDPVQMEVAAEAIPSRELSRAERIERWATVLEQHQGPVKALREIEYLSPEERHAIRGEDSPMSVAYADPVLRSAGLAGDRLGDAMKFFELTDNDAHRLFCDCLYRGTMTGSGLAQRLRIQASAGQRLGIWQRIRMMLSH